jgi:hypothetical protein
MLGWLRAMLLVALFAAMAAPVQAQGTQWQEMRTAQFSLLYPAEARATAEEYAQFVDGIYGEISAFWGHNPPPPVVVRIYPTMELYYQANPLAESLPGVVAHAHTGRREISIAVPQTLGQTTDEIQNNIRHELTHIIAADLSDGRLTTPWQEGIAQYVERPTEQLEAKMQLMRQIIAEGRLKSWAELNFPGATYADPQIGYPQSLTIVAFLIKRDGLDRFRSFVQAWRTTPDYASALANTYGTSVDVLEREWQDQLPQFVNTDYRSLGSSVAANTTFDLTEAENYVARGDYAAAIANLEPLMPVIEQSSDAESLQRARSMLARSEVGVRATQYANDARAALLAGDYRAAAAASENGRAQFEAINQPTQADVMAEYATLAARGSEAQRQLAEAGGLLRRLEIERAQSTLDAAYTTFVELGDQNRAAQAQRLRTLIARGTQIVAGICFVFALLLIVWSLGRRANERRVALPYS